MNRTGFVARLNPVLVLIIAVYFTGGVATVLIDTMVPHFKRLFVLSYTDVMLLQFSFFMAYFFVSLPAGSLVLRFGSIRTILVGLAMIAAGCLLFAPAAAAGVFWGFLVALFVVASGITLFQVAANPLVTVLGAPENGHSRLTFALAFNSLGTTIGPLLGATLILGASNAGGALPVQMSEAALQTYRVAQAKLVLWPFMAIAAVVLLAAAGFWLCRNRPVDQTLEKIPQGTQFALLRKPRLAFGALAMFAYVGGEVSLGSILTNYLMLEKTLHASAATAGRLVSIYWGGALIGRFFGSLLLTRMRTGVLLAGYALASSALALVSMFSSGHTSAFSVIGIGFFNSIMFPTIFALAIGGLGADRPKGSGLMCLSIVGGAVIPLLTGAVSDRYGLTYAPVVPALCYLGIAAYGYSTIEAAFASRSPLEARSARRRSADLSGPWSGTP